MANFHPEWTTPVGALPAVTENDQVSITLVAKRRAVFMGEFNQTTVFVGNAAPYLDEVKVHGDTYTAPADYTLAGQYILFSTPLADTDVVELSTSETLKFALLHDNLPPGLSLSNTGVITGKVGLLPTDGPSLTYAFAVRLTDVDQVVQDREFTIEAIPTEVQIYPPGWGNLPPAHVQTATPAAFSYVPLGSTTRGTPYVYQLDLFLPSGVPPTLVVEPFIGANEIVAPFNEIPPGLVVDEHTGVISGTIDTATPLGRYFFQIKMLDSRGFPITTGTGATPVIFMIDVAAPFNPLEPLRFIVWITPSGSLATVYEAQQFPMGVLATCTTGETPTYSVITNKPLPPGLSLNPTNGDIEGIVGHVQKITPFEFTIRAKVGETFQDRVFSITVAPRYTAASFANVNLKLRVTETKAMNAFYSTTINSGEYFRPNDVNFGTLDASYGMSVFVLGGIKGDLGLIETTVRNSDIKSPVKILLGPHKIAYAKLGGTKIYEVLYREVIDPMTRAGGYTLKGGVPVETPLGYPESNNNPAIQFFHPVSINNIRYEFVDKIGFAAIDPANNHNISLAAGTENLPLWMTSPQVGNTSSSVLGYIPAVVIAYLRPNAGQDVLDRIALRTTDPTRPTDEPDPIKLGHPVDFDQYYVEFQTVSSPTTFTDPDMTGDSSTGWHESGLGDTVDNPAGHCTFDGNDTRFDVYAYSSGKFYRINR